VESLENLWERTFDKRKAGKRPLSPWNVENKEFRRNL